MYNVFMTLWGRIVDQLRTQKGISQGDLARQMIIGKDEYYRLCRSKRGPTILTLDALLKGMGCTWKDWALAHEVVNSDDPPPRKTADSMLKSPQNRPEKARKPTKRG
jgi:transcriptional regulator with XRE-family HTH domain